MAQPSLSCAHCSQSLGTIEELKDIVDTHDCFTEYTELEINEKQGTVHGTKTASRERGDMDSNNTNNTRETYYDADDNNNDTHQTWTDASIKLLLQLYKDKKELVEVGKIKTLKKMFEQIANELSSRGYKVNMAQVENKWKTLERAYKNMLLNKKKTGRGRSYCPYQRELAEILDKRHTIQPPFVVASISNTEMDNTVVEACATNSVSAMAQVNTEVSTPLQSTQSSAKSRQSNTNDVIKELQQLNQTLLRRHSVQEEMERKKIAQRDAIVEQLKIKNDLLKQLLEKST